jgi:Flp pilus assembly protein TadG
MSTKKKPYGQLGNAIVEFAIIAPILILLTLGTIELGRYAYFAILVSNAAQAGAAYGSQNMSTAYDFSGMAAAIAQDASPNPIASVTANPAPVAEWGCWDITNARLSTPFPVATSALTFRPTCAGTATPVPFVAVSAKGTLKPLFHLPFVKTLTVKRTVLRRVQCQVAGAVC